MEITEKIQSVMKESVDVCQVAGVNLLVYQNGKELLYVQEGMADREGGKAISRDTIFRLYSQTKPLTGCAAMILMERGKLDLFQCVGEFLPAYNRLTVVDSKGHIVPSVKPMTIHHLLGMTSGLVYPDPVTLPGKAATAVFEEACRRLHTGNGMTTRELADRMAEVPLAFEPGTSWQYGTSADVLGAVIEEVSGMSLAEFMKKELFDPLEMGDTAFWVPKEKQHRLAKVYETVSRQNGEKALIRYTGDNLAVSNGMEKEPEYAAGGAGLASTLDDYMHFAQMLLQKGTYRGHQILHPATVDFMTGGCLMPGQQENFDNWLGLSGFSYGNLMRVCKNPGQAGFLTSEGEYGWDGWLGAYFANLPKLNMTILMGTQKKDSGTFALTRKLRNLILSHVAEGDI